MVALTDSQRTLWWVAVIAGFVVVLAVLFILNHLHNHFPHNIFYF